MICLAAAIVILDVAPLPGAGGCDCEEGGSSSGVTSLEVSPEALSLSAGETQQFSATAWYGDGSSREVNPSWESSDPAVATINTAGIATAIAPGEADLWVSWGGEQGLAEVTVTP